jgi:hypothetical protein
MKPQTHTDGRGQIAGRLGQLLDVNALRAYSETTKDDIGNINKALNVIPL